MVRTNSMVLELGFQLPNFEMLNANSSKNEYFNFHHIDKGNSIPAIVLVISNFQENLKDE